VLDEPLNGLDVETVARAKELMGALAAEGRTVFYSSHLIDIVSRVCTRVAVLHEGRIRATGTVAEVVAALGAASLEDALLDLGRGAPV
jgi:ABC-2 type transport system ATP-binding protein